MCQEELIPRIDFIARTEYNLANPDRARDIQTAAAISSTTDEVVEEETRIVNLIASPNGPGLRSYLDNRGRWTMQYTTTDDYERIFRTAGFSQRAERQWKDPRDVGATEIADFMFGWCEACLDYPSPEVDALVPPDMELFDVIFERYLPPRLDLGTWIADQLLHTVAERISGRPYDMDEFREWEPAMGDGQVACRQLGNGRFQDIVPFLGEAKPGRLVWRPRDGFAIPYSESLRKEHQRIRKKLRKAEKALITLARRIARDVAVNICERYVKPQVRRHDRAVLERRQVGYAVREILGDEWFDLPFDINDELRSWSEDDVLKPDDEVGMGSIYIGDAAYLED